MTSIAALWMPILVSAVIVFIASSIIHMGPFWHRSEYPQIPNEDKVMDALRPFAIPPGDYMLPRVRDMKDMKSAGFMEKVKRGPVVIMTVLPTACPSMAKTSRSGSSTLSVSAPSPLTSRDTCLRPARNT